MLELENKAKQIKFKTDLYKFRPNKHLKIINHSLNKPDLE